MIQPQTSENYLKILISKHELTSSIFAAIYESDLGFASLKAMASIQEDDILVVRDNDRHNYGDFVKSIPGLPPVQKLHKNFPSA